MFSTFFKRYKEQKVNKIKVFYVRFLINILQKNELIA